MGIQTIPISKTTLGVIYSDLKSLFGVVFMGFGGGFENGAPLELKVAATRVGSHRLCYAVAGVVCVHLYIYIYMYTCVCVCMTVTVCGCK